MGPPSRGYFKRLSVCDETLELLKSHGIEVHIDTIGDAADIDNERVAAAPIAGLFHTTG